MTRERMPLRVFLVWLFLPRMFRRCCAVAAEQYGLTLAEFHTLTRVPQAFFRVRRSDAGYGTTVWLGRVRVGSRKTMTPKWPHVYRSGDEFCNDVLAFHLYPLVSVDIWWRRHQRVATDGMCDRCKKDLREAGWSEQEIAADECARIADWFEYKDEQS